MTMSILNKKLWRDITQHFGRFIAIVMIIFLGVLLFVGVRGIGPALKDSATHELDQQQLADIQLISPAGFSKADQVAWQQKAAVTVSRARYRQVQTKAGEVVAFYSQPTNLNRPRLTEGRLAKTNREIVLDARAASKYHYRLGQTLTLSGQGFKTSHLTIVGFAQSPQYVDNTQRGAATIGDGTVAFFAYAKPSALQMPITNVVWLRLNKIDHSQRYTDHYTRQVTQVVDRLTPMVKAQLATKSQQQEQTIAQLTRANQAQPTPARTQQLAQLKAQTFNYQVQTQADYPGFSAYGDTADRISAIANVFPVFFFLIAALITFTTITRLIEEARGQLGIMKALGYANHTIARNYWGYALITAILGTTLGVIIGSLWLPRFVLQLYTTMYIFDRPVIYFQWDSIALASLFALLSTLGAALIVIWQQLRVGPAELMLPKAPRSAKRILMEHWTWLWQRLSFNQKVSYRNLFRFKSRLIMTVIGIAGGLGLLLTGFGIRDAITATGTRQMDDILRYQVSIRANEADKVTPAIKKLTHVNAVLPVASSLVSVKAHAQQVNDVNLNQVTSSTLPQFIQLKNTNGHALKVDGKGIIISQKLATLLHVKHGDTITYKTPTGQAKRATVAGIMVNYVGHVMYQNSSAPANTLLIKQPKLTAKQEQQFAKAAMKIPGVQNVSFKADQLSSIATMTKQLNPVIAIFILLSGTLSLVVLYNLTNINISERLRELSTIKVLGFYDREVTAYIIRENIILTVAGIIVGYGIGNALTAYILHQAETPQIVFPLTITWSSYLWSTGLMLGFTAIVMFMTHRQLQHIDMLDALKAND